MEQSILIISGFILGAIVGYFISKKTILNGSDSSELDSLKSRIDGLQKEKDSLINDKTKELFSNDDFKLVTNEQLQNIKSVIEGKINEMS